MTPERLEEIRKDRDLEQPRETIEELLGYIADLVGGNSLPQHKLEMLEREVRGFRGALNNVSARIAKIKDGYVSAVQKALEETRHALGAAAKPRIPVGGTELAVAWRDIDNESLHDMINNLSKCVSSLSIYLLEVADALPSDYAAKDTLTDKIKTLYRKENHLPSYMDGEKH